jgi:lysophospholipase L1-like esterase
MHVPPANPSRFRLLACAALALPLLVACTQTAGTHDKAAGNATDPMPLFVPGSRILFQGDSITDGNRGRNSDPNHILGHGYQAEIAARFGADLYDRHLTFMNRGISGDTVGGLERRWQTDTLALKPDVLSILIGVNDIRVPADRWEQQYDQFLSETVAALPHVKLVLGEPFGLPVGPKKNNWEEYRAQLEGRQEIVRKLAAKYHAACVHYQAMFDEAARRAPADYWIWDGVHPTYSGHQLMADEWVRTVRAFWPAGSVPPLPTEEAASMPAAPATNR